MNWTETNHCQSRAHCHECRTNALWRARVGAPEECPHAIRGLGDIVEIIARPIAKLLRIPCREAGQLKPESPCAKRRDKLNKILPL